MHNSQELIHVTLPVCTAALVHITVLTSFCTLLKVMLQVLYKLKTAKVFEKARSKEEKANTDIVEEDPFAIQTMSWCPESRMLCVAGVSAHVLIYRFSKQEVTTEVVQVGGTNQSVRNMQNCTNIHHNVATFLSDYNYLLHVFRAVVNAPLCDISPLLFSFWRCGCRASLAMGTPLIQEESRPPPCPTRELPPALRRVSPPASPPQEATPPTDPGTISHACSTDNCAFWFCFAKRLNWVKQVVTEHTDLSEVM